jgi:hypothetical protein
MGFPAVNIFERAQPEDSPVRARAVESLRTALQLAPDPADMRPEALAPNDPASRSSKPPDIALAMGLAREAIATAAKAAEDELARLRDLLRNAEARVAAAEDRTRAAEEHARAADAQRAEAEMLLDNIRDQIVSKVIQRRAA